ncbi:Panacea domain-containing protein [Loigolactobacillus bifermentans]|uniref:Antitoxin SocA-like Panacea domain-containing protein n=1 Tax=Loigolactobacillus bifermentans DSM 20003 TaxID=1423726 RepID=A0A0R1H2G6_9LACO|nr:type II toxin-antitoxin system antitoxin SocA domain-containing protein [Loigolactobacillus bifermentans]KRK40781.1 hypothetical protein FC07_GL002530 [Loigolactobacillus bifermentans DSM 20003]QGG59533.1 DUF4065 domain-containing protein [Loigolactobacillus bifermentans]
MENNLSVFDVANWFLRQESMSDKKLQKLCYYAYAWGMALLNRPLISDSKFEAWAHGPVSPELYKECKEYGWTDIPQDKFTNAKSIEDKSIVDLLESVWATYGDRNADELEALTHRETPWRTARTGVMPGERSNKQLDDKIMHDFYLGIYNGD